MAEDDLVPFIQQLFAPGAINNTGPYVLMIQFGGVQPGDNAFYNRFVAQLGVLTGGQVRKFHGNKYVLQQIPNVPNFAAGVANWLQLDNVAHGKNYVKNYAEIVRLHGAGDWSVL